MEETELLNLILIVLLTVLTLTIIIIVTVTYFHNRMRKSQYLILELNIANRKKVLSAILDSQEKERLKISNKLHDEVGSKLAGLKYIFERNVPKMEIKETGMKTFKEITKVIRDLSHDLASFTLDKFGLSDSIRELIYESLEINGYKVEYVSNISSSILSKESERQIYRIIQELILNTIKHSGGKEIKLQIIENTLDCSIIYEDKGFGISKEIIKGFGLNSIDSRIESLEGQGVYNSITDCSFSLKIIIPKIYNL